MTPPSSKYRFVPPSLSHPRDMDPPIVWAEYYVELGWGLCHIEPGVKAPKAEGWNTPAGWIATLDQVREQWMRTPAHGMGLIHAASGTVAIDIDEIDHTRRIFVEFGLDLDGLLAGAPRIRGKRSGRDKAIFRAPEGDPLPMHKAAWRRAADDVLTLFELRAGGVQDVLPPSLHPDGHRYEWVRAPWELGNGIPTLPDELLAFWREFPSLRDQIAAMDPKGTPWQAPSRRPPALVEEPHNDVIGAFNRATSIDAMLQSHGYVRKGKRYLAPSSKTRIPGVAVLEDGRVFSHHGSDVLADGHAHDAFDLYCLLDHAGDQTAALRAASTQLGLPVYGAAIGGMMDFSELLASAAKAARQPEGEVLERPPFPAPLLEVPGLVGELASYINRTARYPQPILALAAAIAAAGTLMGRKVRTESDLRTNVYVLGVAEAGAGKEHARQAIRRVFDAAGAFKKVAVEGVASDAAINTALISTPSSLFLLDEIGRLLAMLTDQRAGSHLSEIITALLKLYSAAAGPYTGKIYADADRSQVIQQPNLSIYGTTVPGNFHGALTTAQVEDGFLSRLMVFESEDPDPEPVDVFVQDPPTHLVELCAAWERAPEHADPSRGNLDELLRPFPRVVAPDAEARMLLSRFERDMRERRKELRRRGQPTGLYVRTAANALKLALIRGAGCDVEHPRITAEDARWGCQLALFLADSMAWRVLAHVAENTTERHTKRVARLIQEAGAEGITRGELTRKTQWLRASERNDVLATLAQSGEIFSRRMARPKGPPADSFIWYTHAAAEEHEADPNPSNSSTPFKEVA